MGSPGSNIDPRTKRYDLSSDPVTYTSQRLELLDSKIKDLPNIYLNDGETSTEFRSTFYRFTRRKRRFLKRCIKTNWWGLF